MTTSQQQARSVFRRGGQKESGNDPTKDLHNKLELLAREWTSDRVGKDQTIGLWKESLQLVEIIRPRGKLLHAMGFFMNQKHYLHIEEAVFLMDRGSLLLFLEGSSGSTWIASLQEAYETMVRLATLHSEWSGSTPIIPAHPLNIAGVSVDLFVIYCRLKRNGYIVRRYPVMWSVAAEEVAASLWKDWGSDTFQSTNTGQGNHTAQLQVLNTSGPRQLQEVVSTSRAPPSEGIVKDAGWWPGVSDTHPWLADAVDILPDVPKCGVAPIEEEPAVVGPPPLLSIGRHGHTVDGPKPQIVFEVFQPNSNFKRKSPDAPLCAVCVASEIFHNLGTLKHTESLRIGIPIMYAMVEDGDVMFFSVTKTTTTLS